MKNKKILIPLIAVVVLGILLAVVVLTVDKPKEDTVGSDASYAYEYEKNYLFDFSYDTISYIKVNNETETFAFVNEEQNWILENSPEVSISSASVLTLASSIVNIAYSEVIDDKSISKEDCGITDETPYVTFKCNDGEITVYRGINTADGMWAYVMTSVSDNVYLADIASVDEVFRPLAKYRNSASLNINFDSLNSIVYKADVQITFEKGEADAQNAIFNLWRMTSPVQMSARDDQITKLIIDPLKAIKITDYVSDKGDFANYGLGSKDRYIALSDDSGKIQTLYFSKEQDGKYYISVNDKNSIYSIDYDAAPYVELETKEIFDRNIHLVQMKDIKNVTLKGGEYDYIVEFGETGGRINGKDVSADAMNQQIFPAVCGLFADDILLETTGEEKVNLTFEYKNSGKDVISFLEYNERYYAVAKNGSVKYMILKAKLDDLAKTFDECK